MPLDSHVHYVENKVSCTVTIKFQALVPTWCIHGLCGSMSGGPLGTGQQWVSWIHRDDVVGLIIEAIGSKSFDGVYNATAPNPVRMGEFCNILGQVLGRPSWLPVPEFALRGLLSDGAMLVLEGQRVLPSRTQDAGYRFQFAEVKDALRNLFG